MTSGFYKQLCNVHIAVSLTVCTIKAICIRSIRIEFAVCRREKIAAVAEYQVKAVVTTTSIQYMNACMQYHVKSKLDCSTRSNAMNKKKEKISNETVRYNPKMRKKIANRSNASVNSFRLENCIFTCRFIFFYRTRFSSQYVLSGERFCVQFLVLFPPFKVTMQQQCECNRKNQLQLQLFQSSFFVFGSGVFVCFL